MVSAAELTTTMRARQQQEFGCLACWGWSLEAMATLIHPFLGCRKAIYGMRELLGPWIMGLSGVRGGKKWPAPGCG